MSEIVAEFTIELQPITKKNSQRILKNWRTGKRFIGQSEQYKQYEKDAVWFLKPLGIDYPVNVKAVFYLGRKNRTDLANLNSALHDVLVAAGTVVDDHCRIIYSTDGSHVEYDKEQPRTEVTITKI
ncbi:hypothetical protein LI142_10940 [Eubacterium limosum]|uniref:RusA family crossover junction endodeoxyribonuclease n=1 Tax=Eubacterium limosum TaxID=1736 RepID=UPI001D084202|nr:hypothetical protein [Eubacterium limosum]MCB6570014.1 hypothetical protein [Eubacterium limosum]